jgi:hypothetical protein
MHLAHLAEQASAEVSGLSDLASSVNNIEHWEVPA